jgi:hypothetical protein
MAQERTVRREVHQETVEAPQTTQEVTRETRSVQTEQVAPAAPAGGVTNVNVSHPTPAVTEEGAVVSTGGNVSINTPDGTQVNVNS